VELNTAAPLLSQSQTATRPVFDLGSRGRLDRRVRS